MSGRGVGTSGVSDFTFWNNYDALYSKFVYSRPYTGGIKESTKPMEFRLHTQQRAVHRSIFNSSVAIKLCIMERQKKQVEKLYKTIEEEEVRMMRRNMIPRAQLMPLFDKPFSPQRSTRPLTIPRDPSFIKNQSHVLYL